MVVSNQEIDKIDRELAHWVLMEQINMLCPPWIEYYHRNELKIQYIIEEYFEDVRWFFFIADLFGDDLL